MTALPVAADFACVPMSGLTGKLIGAAEWLAEATEKGSLEEARRYQHAFVYAGMLSQPTRLGINLPRFGWRGPGCYCVQAEPGGARLGWLGSSVEDVPLRYGGAALWSTGLLFPTIDQRALILNTALLSLGTPYSFLDYLSLAQLHMGLVVPGLRGYVASSGHMICSQLVDYCWKTGRYQLFDDKRSPGDVMPLDLARVLLAVRAQLGLAA